MRFMIIVKATKDSEAGVMPEDKLIAAMATYHEELAKRVRCSMLPGSRGVRRVGASSTREGSAVVDGPFTETKDLIAGYTLIQVKSKDEALEWTKRFPNPAMKYGEIEVRQLFEVAPSEGIERFRTMRIGKKH